MEGKRGGNLIGSLVMFNNLMGRLNKKKRKTKKTNMDESKKSQT